MTEQRDRQPPMPWKRRPQSASLLAALANPDRGFDAVVIGEPQRAFYGNQFGNTFPLFTHYGVQLWVPEVGGPIDPDNKAHDLIMSVFGGMSKGERNRIRVRVRSSMGVQARHEGRFLGGRPPYGYRLVDLGPHPNPAKAADGRMLRGLEPDPTAAPVVQRIYREYLLGLGIFSIAEGLTSDGIPCPSAHDPARNSHRSGIARSKQAVRVILTNPRYTGHQVWTGPALPRGRLLPLPLPHGVRTGQPRPAPPRRLPPRVLDHRAARPVDRHRLRSPPALCHSRSHGQRRVRR
ncbi:recombinase family protein [Kitasatospora sp. NPDC017646]|uniref:recombinase family protein n=1 Tax=Kitasatospora sp. NPDC017646 TaxID=3364024 RepID=UPI0037943A1B